MEECPAARRDILSDNLLLLVSSDLAFPIPIERLPDSRALSSTASRVWIDRGRGTKEGGSRSIVRWDFGLIGLLR